MRRKNNELEAKEKAQRGNLKTSPSPKAPVEGGLKDKPWHKTIKKGHRLKFVLDLGTLKTIVPKDAIPGMKLDKSKQGSFRVANGDVIPNLGSTKLKSNGTPRG